MIYIYLQSVQKNFLEHSKCIGPNITDRAVFQDSEKINRKKKQPCEMMPHIFHILLHTLYPVRLVRQRNFRLKWGKGFRLNL